MNDSQQVQSVRLPRIPRQDLAIAPLRLVESARLMKLNGRLKGLLIHEWDEF
jgi:hypothetical protein